MKLILSRKGFDSSSGGGPSPILPDGRLVSLPIPDAQSRTSYAEIRVNGKRLGPLVQALSKGKIKPSTGAHLDPDLDATGQHREPGWRGLFGQMGAAQGHLCSRGVGPGDLFLFFGWFRAVERYQNQWRFKPKAPDYHILFGWLQISEVWHLGDRVVAVPLWAQTHPHQYGDRGRNNTIYVGEQSLRLPRVQTQVAGHGFFPRCQPELVLTQQGRTRCHWSLPKWFHPQNRRSRLSYHDRCSRWQKSDDRVHLHSVARGQEFVLDLDHYPEAFAWLATLFSLLPPMGESQRVS